MNLAVPYRQQKRIKRTSTPLTRMARGMLTPSAGLPSWKSESRPLITEPASSRREPTSTRVPSRPQAKRMLWFETGREVDEFMKRAGVPFDYTTDGFEHDGETS